MKTPEQFLKELALGEIEFDLGSGQKIFKENELEYAGKIMRMAFPWGSIISHTQVIPEWKQKVRKLFSQFAYNQVRSAVLNYIYAIKWKFTKSEADRFIHRFFEPRSFFKYTNCFEISASIWASAREKMSVTQVVQIDFVSPTGYYFFGSFGKASGNGISIKNHIMTLYDVYERRGSTACGIKDSIITSLMEWDSAPVDTPNITCSKCWTLVHPVPKSPSMELNAEGVEHIESSVDLT